MTYLYVGIHWVTLACFDYWPEQNFVRAVVGFTHIVCGLHI